MAHSMLSTPEKTPLPPSPVGSAHRTPGLSIDQALTPAADKLLTPNGKSPNGLGLVVPSTSTSTLETPTKRGGAYQSPKRLEAERDGQRKRTIPVLEDFELIRVIGKGCAGRVMMVRHTATARVHAMKAISKRSVLTHDELPHTLTEANIMKHFAVTEPRNQFVAKLHYSFTDKENIYFVMEFYPGGDLATQMEIYGILGPVRTRFYACDLTMGLEDLHRHGIIVRDLKPENILINRRGHAVLADFGLAKDFGYRGEPTALVVPNYPDQPVAPYWAGAGAGSVRIGRNGRPKVMVDRACSFVGTPEYLAPEVVTAGEYSYAVDWWGLGCIILESLVGRVPFRKEEHEPPIVLWDKLAADPWQDVFLDPKVAMYHPDDYGLDETTVDMIDGLLQKDPLWRLTEPHVRSHPYFGNVDWELVRSGEYEDPEGLEFHQNLELNTTYFPKLFLDETPNVDMSDHDVQRIDGDMLRKATALSDDRVFAWEHLKAKQAFDSFAWSRYDILSEQQQTGAGHGIPNGSESSAKGDGETLNWSVSEHAQATTSTSSECLSADAPARSSAEYASEPRLPNESTTERSHPATPAVRSHSIASPTSIKRQLEGGPASESSLTVPASPNVDPATLPLPLSPSPTSSQTPLPTTSPKSAKATSPRNKRDLVLQLGLPATGLSTSDIVSVASPDVNSPTRLIRRHAAGKPSVDTTANSRLSVDLHGTTSRLGDDDWEQLDTSAIPSLPNAAPSAFFTRGFGGVLRRRPSGHMPSSSLKRQTKTSDSSSRGSSSPTKHRPLFTVKSIENTKKVLRKAFPIRLKRDSKSSKDQTTAGLGFGVPPVPLVAEKHRAAAAAAAAGGDRPSSGAASSRPQAVQRSHTESSSTAFASAPNTASGSWFSTRRLGRLSGTSKRTKKPSKTHSSSSSDSGTNLAASTGQLRLGPGGVPKLELTHTPPIVWEMDGGQKPADATDQVERSRSS